MVRASTKLLLAQYKLRKLKLTLLGQLLLWTLLGNTVVLNNFYMVTHCKTNIFNLSEFFGRKNRLSICLENALNLIREFLNNNFHNFF